MNTFKVGDRVVVVEDHWGVGIMGREAVVTNVDLGLPYEADSVMIEIYGWTGGHNGMDADCDIVNRWRVNAEDIEHLKMSPPPGIDAEIGITKNLITDDPALREQIPLSSGLFDYFPSALIEVSKVSFKGNEQHNSGQALHWSREKSAGHYDTMLRHFLERGTIDTDGTRHSAKMAWRALAILQLELEQDGAPKARGAR